MSSRPPTRSLRDALARSHGALRAAWATRFGLRAGSTAVLAIAAAIAIGALLPGGETSAWVRLALLALAIAIAVVRAVLAFAAAAPGFDTYLETIECRFPEVRSWLRNALDFQTRAPRDTSAELAGAVTAEAAKRFESVPVSTLRPGVQPRRPAWIAAGSIAVVVLLAVVAPARVGRSWATLIDPTQAAPPLHLVIETGSVKISPGASLAVRARVGGTKRAPVLLRDGERPVAAVPEGAASDGTTRWRFDLSQLTRDQDYRVKVVRLESPRYHIALAGEPVPVGFEIDYHLPSYARLPSQRGSATRGDLSALRGTRARVEVTFDRDLEALDAALPGAAPARWDAVSARRWRGEVPISRDGEYELRARATSGAASYRYRITAIPDAPPVLAVRIPTGDLDLPTGQQIAVDVIGQDDLGLTELKLQFRKDPAAPWQNLTLAHMNPHPREASIQTRWDASSLGMLPGETATFRFELYDDNAISGRGRAVSPAFELRFPSLADLYEQLDDTHEGVQKSLEKLADQTREVQKSLDKLARQPQRNSPQQAPAFERSEEMKSSLERQRQIGQKIDEAAKQVKQSLEQAAERSAYDEQLTRKMREMAELMQQIQSPEFKDAMKRMQQALENLDKNELERNLDRMRKNNQDMLQSLERTIDLLKQMRDEERLEALAKRAEELKQHQDALNQAHDTPPKSGDAKSREAEAKERAAQQQEAAEKTEQLAKDAREQAQQLEQAQQQQGAESAAQELEQQASPSQKQAASNASQGKNQQARQSGQKASESLKRAAEQLTQMVQQAQQQRESADLAAIRRAAQDLVSLQREAERNLQSSEPLQQRADRQTDLSEGAARVADSLYAMSRKTPFISPKLGEALGRAIQNLGSSGKEMGSGNRQRGEGAGQSGTSALNEAVLELRQTESSMCQSPSNAPGQKPGSMAGKVGDLGEQQSRLNQQTRKVSRRLSEQMSMAAGDQAEVRRLAAEQQRLREQLEQIQKDDETRHELLGKLDQARREMKDVEETLSSGATPGDLEEKQNRILSRLLDAQRSVNRRDYDPKRESHVGHDVLAPSAAELPADLLRESDRLRLDLLKAETDRYPAQYRAFIEAYLRTLNGSRR